MAVRVDKDRCAYIKGECECHNMVRNEGSGCCCNNHEVGACDNSCDCACQGECHTGCVSDIGEGCCSGNECLGCAEICPEDAIGRMDRKVVIDEERCTECGLCMTVCAYDAIYIPKG